MSNTHTPTHVSDKNWPQLVRFVSVGVGIFWIILQMCASVKSFQLGNQILNIGSCPPNWGKWWPLGCLWKELSIYVHICTRKEGELMDRIASLEDMLVQNSANPASQPVRLCKIIIVQQQLNFQRLCLSWQRRYPVALPPIVAQMTPSEFSSPSSTEVSRGVRRHTTQLIEIDVP